MKRIVTTFILLWSAQLSVGQTFNNRYNFPVYSGGEGYSVEEWNNQYYIFSNMGDSLIKCAVHVLDYAGNVISSQKFLADSAALFNGYSNTTDRYFDGYISAGGIDQWNDSTNGLIIKWSFGGDTIATKTILPSSNFSRAFFQQAKAVSDGFIAVGSLSDGNGIERIFLVKTDFELNEVWRRLYGATTAPHAGYSVVQTPDGGYLIGGVRKITDSWDHVIIKTDDTGVQQDIAYFGWLYEGSIAHVDVVAEGEYVFGGRKKTTDNDSQSMVCKLDANLNEVWCNTYNEPGPECAVHSIKVLDDGNLIACGKDRSNYEMFGYITKIDPEGNALWYRKYMQTADNWSYLQDVIPTADGGYFLTGKLYSDPGLTSDIWGLKLDDMGCLVPGCDTLQSVLNTDVGIDFSIYPNPTSQFINVYLSSPNPVQNIVLEISDLQGRVVKSYSPHLSDTTYMMDIQELPAGMYLFSMLVDGAVVRSERLMKE